MSDGSPSKVGTYLLFAAFGGGCSWFATSLAFMEIPIYQRSFGLDLSNRLAIGYNLGTIPCWLVVRSKQKWLWFLLGTQVCSVLMLCAAIPGSPFFFGAPSRLLPVPRGLRRLRRPVRRGALFDEL
mmetsp:Transcript_29329/g.94628  ORF Transcript_29329/g.94628 Transcript_29329/m.94628 type:complete len:126 (-) Transcript_29329:970-1347(-)